MEAHARGLTRLLFDDDAAATGSTPMAGGASDHRDDHRPRAQPGADPLDPQRPSLRAAGDDALVRQAAGLIARAHAFDDLHRATGYSPARLTYVALHPAGGGS